MCNQILLTICKKSIGDKMIIKYLLFAIISELILLFCNKAFQLSKLHKFIILFVSFFILTFVASFINR
ncbi:hypothetical protein BW27_11765 [Clostridioides difficile]|nr:hypothetical protein BW27_11765 [Clostridioides difficile]